MGCLVNKSKLTIRIKQQVVLSKLIFLFHDKCPSPYGCISKSYYSYTEILEKETSVIEPIVRTIKRKFEKTFTTSKVYT